MEIVRKITTWKMAEKEHHENGRPENTHYCNCKKKHTLENGRKFTPRKGQN